MLKFIQYSILFILIANGSYPLLVDHGILDTHEAEVDCTEMDHDPDQEQQEEDDLAAPDKHVYKEPKPNDLEENEDLVGLESPDTRITDPSASETIQHTVVAQRNISRGILRYVYYSKSSTLSSEA